MPTKNLHSSAHSRLVVSGVTNIITGKNHRFISSTINKETFLQAIKRINNYYRRREPNKLTCVVIDGHPAHRSLLVKEWEKRQPNFFFYRLPKNSPELSPIEYFWRPLRKEVTHNCLYGSLSALRSAVIKFWSRWAHKATQLLAWVNALIKKIWATDILNYQLG